MYHVAVSPDGSKVYVTNTSPNTVSVIDTAMNTLLPSGLTATPTGVRPTGIVALTGSMSPTWTRAPYR